MDKRAITNYFGINVNELAMYTLDMVAEYREYEHELRRTEPQD